MLMTSISDGSTGRSSETPLLRQDQRRGRRFRASSCLFVANSKPDISGRNTPGGPKSVPDNQPLTTEGFARPSGFLPPIRVHSCRFAVKLRSTFLFLALTAMAASPVIKLNQSKSNQIKVRILRNQISSLYSEPQSLRLVKARKAQLSLVKARNFPGQPSPGLKPSSKRVPAVL